MNIKIAELKLEDGFIAQSILALYKEAGWANHDDSSSVAKALKNSFCAFGAFDGDKLIGYFRALSDGVADAYLIDMIVSEKYRKMGIGSMLTEAIVRHLKEKNIEWITAISTPMGRNMYLKFGKEMPGHTPIRF